MGEVLFSAQVVEVLAAWVLAVVVKAVHGELTLLALEQHPPRIVQMERMAATIFSVAEMAVEAGLVRTLALGLMVVQEDFQVEVEAEQVAVMTAQVMAVREDEAKLGFGPTDEWTNTTKPSRTIRSGRTEG